MAIQHYEGNLGVFDYDDCLFEHYDCGTMEYLHYIGSETDGHSIKIPEGITDCNSMFFDCGLLTPPDIPDGVINCRDMFIECKSLETPPVIPDSVTNCRGMFARCVSLETPPVIPNSVKDCNNMFSGCASLETSPDIPDSVTNCRNMFGSCEKLKNPSEIPNGAKDCRGMFSDCTSLETPPVVPDSVEDYINMFNGCTEHIWFKGNWQIEHRGLSFDESLKKYKDYIPESFMNNKSKPTAEFYSVLDVAIKYEKSGEHTAYGQILEGVSNGILTTVDDIKHATQIADKIFARSKNTKRDVDLTGGINFSQDTQLSAGD